MTDIFTGYLLVFLDLKLDSFDLLPDFLGYIFIFSGLRRLAGKNGRFVQAQPWALGMALFALGIGAGNWLGLECGIVIVVLFNLLSVLMSLTLFYLIVMGIQDLERLDNVALGFSKLLLVWKINAVLQVACVILLCFANEMAGLVPATVAILALLAGAALLLLLYKAKTVHP